MFLHFASHLSSQVAGVWHVSVVGFSAGRWNGEKGKVSLTVIWSQMIHWGEKDILRHWAVPGTHLFPFACVACSALRTLFMEIRVKCCPVNYCVAEEGKTKQNKTLLWKVVESKTTFWNQQSGCWSTVREKPKKWDLFIWSECIQLL